MKQLSKEQAERQIEELQAYIKALKQNTFKCGDKFMVERDLMILTQVYDRVYCLISLSSGNRYKNPIHLDYPSNSIPFIEVERLGYEVKKHELKES